MATTALDHISAALRVLRVKAAGEVPSADEAQDSLSALNAMLGQWQIEPGMLYASPFTSLSDAKTLPTGYDLAIKYNLAIELAPEFGAEIPEIVYRNAMTSKGNIMRWSSSTPTMVIDTETINGTNYRRNYDITEDI